MDEHVKNLLSLFNSATPEQIERGVKWYQGVYDWCNALAGHIQERMEDKLVEDVPDTDELIKRIAGVVAVMSPRMPWDRNLDVAEKIVWNAITGGRVTELKLGILGNTMKATLIMLTGEFELLGTQKVFKFWRNIVDAEENSVSDITVDTWAWRAYHLTNATTNGISPKEYAEIEKAYLEASERVGLPAHVFQAIVWEVTRDNPAYHPE